MSNREAHAMIGNNVPLSFVPKQRIEKYDAGIESVEYHQYIPKNPPCLAINKQVH